MIDERISGGDGPQPLVLGSWEELGTEITLDDQCGTSSSSGGAGVAGALSTRALNEDPLELGLRNLCTPTRLVTASRGGQGRNTHGAGVPGRSSCSRVPPEAAQCNDWRVLTLLSCQPCTYLLPCCPASLARAHLFAGPDNASGSGRMQGASACPPADLLSPLLQQLLPDGMRPSTTSCVGAAVTGKV